MTQNRIMNILWLGGLGVLWYYAGFLYGVAIWVGLWVALAVIFVAVEALAPMPTQRLTLLQGEGMKHVERRGEEADRRAA